MQRLTQLSLLFMLNATVNAQTVKLSGTVTDETGLAIMYVNIGVPEKNTGTVSDTQ